MIFSLPADLCVLLLFIVASAGIGRRLLSLFTPTESLSPAGDFLLSAGLGFFCFSYAAYALGLAGLVYRPVFLVMFLGTALSCGKTLTGLFKRRLELRPPIFSNTEKALLGLILTGIVFNFLYNYCPMTAEDEISTYLGLPSKWANAHTIYALPGASAQYFPYGILANYMALISTGSTQTARLFHFLCGLFCISGLWLLARKFLDRSTALLACSIFYITPVVTSLSGVGNTDLGTLFYALLAIYSFTVWLDTRDSGILMLTAVLTGAYATCKYTTFTLLILLPLFIIYEQKKDTVKAIKNSALFALIAFSALVPYLMRNGALTGNPLYPTRLPGLNYDELLYFAHMQKQPFSDLLGILAKLSSAGDIIWGVGAVFTIFFPAIFFFPLKDKAGRNISVTFSTIALLNIFLLFLAKISFQLTRHSLLSFALLSIPTAYAIARLCAIRALRAYCITLTTLSLAANLSLSIYFGAKRLPVFLGLEARDTYFNRAYNFWETSYFTRYINANIPAGSGIFFLCDLAAPQLNYPLHRVSGMDSFKPEFYGFSPERAAFEMKKRGISYIVVVWKNISQDTGGGFLWPRDGSKKLKIEWLKDGFAVPLENRNGVTLYALPEKAAHFAGHSLP